MTAENIHECRMAWKVLADATPNLKHTDPQKWEAALSALTCLTCYLYTEEKLNNRGKQNRLNNPSSCGEILLR